jgi:hypothetical protein
VKQIYIVSRYGPEWNDLVRALECERAAQHFADTKNETRNLMDVFERSSDFIVTSLELEESP